MKNKIIFLRHADTQKDPSINAALWGLSKIGEQQAYNVATLKDLQCVDVIYVSEERKTTLTIKSLAQRLAISIQSSDLFNEVKRGDKFLTEKEFEAEKVKQLEDLNYSAFNGESGYDARDRFIKGADIAIKDNPGKIILIVTHGTILNIYFADLLNAYNELVERWKKTSFCSYGIVENGIVVKDIIS